MNTLAPGGRRKDMRSCYRIGPHITIGPRLRLELVTRLMELAFEIEDTVYLSERLPLQDKFAAIADLLSPGRNP